ncbi:hypothetical protein Tco_0718002 [Tanacetum coccineum]
MALGEVLTNLPLSTPGLKGLENRSLNLLAPQPLQLMLKTRLLTLRSYLRSEHKVSWVKNAVAQVANALGTWRFSVRGQVRITRETVMGTVFDRHLRIAIKGVMIRRVMTVAVMTGRVATVIRSHGRTKVSSTTVLLGLQVRKDTRTMPPLLHVTHVGNFIRAGHVIGLLELVSLVVRLGIWLGIALRMVETVVGEMGTTINLLLRGEYFLRPRIRQLTLQFFGVLVLVILSILDSLRFGEEGVISGLSVLSLRCVFV